MENFQSTQHLPGSKVDFEQGDISEDFGAKNYYAPKMFWLPIFSTLFTGVYCYKLG